MTPWCGSSTKQSRLGDGLVCVCVCVCVCVHVCVCVSQRVCVCHGACVCVHVTMYMCLSPSVYVRVCKFKVCVDQSPFGHFEPGNIYITHGINLAYIVYSTSSLRVYHILSVPKSVQCVCVCITCSVQYENARKNWNHKDK